MTHPNHQTNGASLEDCHTNFFALTDLCGIKWRKLVHGETVFIPEPTEDPILKAFHRCLAADILCVWRRVATAVPQSADINGGLFDNNPFQTPPVKHPPLSLHAAKELWIFWYGEEPDLSGLVDPELLTGEGQQGSWETGLTYECRSLLFKALHNLIERCLLSRDCVRLGKFFVQPHDGHEKVMGKNTYLSFSFAFFVHGESTVCASVDVREHPPVYSLTRQHLAAAQSSTTGTPVILAPNGLAGNLTGVAFKSTDSNVGRFVDEWRNFYPVHSKYLCRDLDPDLPPPVVEVLVGGVKMKYPSCYVLVTDMDEPGNPMAAPTSCLLGKSSPPVVNNKLSSGPASPPCSPCPNKRKTNQVNSVVLATDYHAISSSYHINSMHNNPSAAVRLPEWVWQDSILNNVEQESNEDKSQQTQQSQVVQWDFTDPTRKTNCNCSNSRCKKSQNWKVGSSSGNAKNEQKAPRRIPFHRRPDDGFEVPFVRSSSSGTPSGGPPSYPRGQSMTPNPVPTLHGNGLNDSLPVPSVGSPASAAPSPLPNPHSQPASIPPADPTMPTLSPHPPASNSQPNQPSTPLETHDKASPAATPDAPNPKSVSSANQMFSPYPNANSVDQKPGNTNENNPLQSVSNNVQPSPASFPVLKRPVLSYKEYENVFMEEEHQPSDLLYDYSALEAWFNHPVKKFKPDTKESRKKSYLGDLYSTHQPNRAPTPPPQTIKLQIKQEPNTTASLENSDSCQQNIPNSGVKRSDPYEFDDDMAGPNDEDRKFEGANGPSKLTSGNLFTSEGLTASYSDLDQIFDNSDDTSSDEPVQVPTPPNSNKPAGFMEDNSQTILVKPPRGSGGAILRPEELCKMFPTPPSMEHNPIASPSGHLSDGQMSELVDGTIMPRFKQEIYPNMGSPQEEPIEDWSYVFRPPLMFKMVGSSKYAPLTNLPSQNLPPVTLPSDCVYKPSWLQAPEKNANTSTNNANNNNSNSNNNNSNNNNNNNNQNNNSSSSNNSSKTNPNPSNNIAANNNSTSSNVTSNVHNSNSNNAPAVSNTPAPPMPPSRPGSVMHQPRAGLSPISPANFPPSPMMNNMFRGPGSVGGGVRTPCPPPPPYEMPSPATSTASSYLNKNLNSVEPAPTPVLARAPEANSLVVNIWLSDTGFNIFRDHNFDSCTLCVCNAGPKCVGNIRGADAPYYLQSQQTHALPPPPNSPFSSMGMNGPPPPYGMLGAPGSPPHNSHNHHEDDLIRCSCGFSAVVNRKLSHKSGLFYEDELEITGLAEDPNERRKNSLYSYLASMNKENINLDSSVSEAIDIIPQNILELLREQFVAIQSASNSLHRAARLYRNYTNVIPYPMTVNVLEFTDCNDVTVIALEQGRLAAEATSGMCKTEDSHSRHSKVPCLPSVHRWPFLRARGPQCNQDIVRVMKILQPILQEAIQKKCTTRLWEAPYTVSGPLTWRQFHRLAGRGTDDRCEPQPIPSLLVGYEKDWLSLSPYAIHFWDKLLLEPYSYMRDVAYIVVTPENDFVLQKVRTFFKELSSTYEVCRLGRHSPITKVLRDGILRVGKSAATKLAKEPLDDWFTNLGENQTCNLLKLYAQACKYHLAAHLSQVTIDRTLLDPPEGTLKTEKPTPPPSSDSSSNPGQERAPSTPVSDIETESPAIGNSCQGPTDYSHDDDDSDPPTIVIYLVEPFTMGSDSVDLQRLSLLALLRCYANVLSSVPENVKSNICVQIISLESIMELGKARENNRHNDHMRSLALSVFSQCRKLLVHTSNVKSLTGFGTAALADLFLKSKDEKNRAPYRLYSPPYILAPHKERVESNESFGKGSTQHGSVLYVSYCLSEDQRMLLTVATDDTGSIFESQTINIEIPNRSRRKKASARRIGLQKLMDFILGIISQSVQPWRLVVGRIGRIGHGELKGWSWLLSRKSLLKASKHLREICNQCSLLSPTDVPCILSACLVSLEPDSMLRLMPDQFTPDERFSTTSVNCQLSTPQDVTCTHILVFPTSATSQSSQTAFNEQHINGPDLGDDDIFSALNEDDVAEGIDGMQDLNDIFSTWPDACPGGVQSPTGSPRRNDSMSQQGSPSCNIEGNMDQQGSFPCNVPSRNGGNGEAQEEVGTLLQQPLALGYFVSTAPTGPMPSWFWASCPHLENVCPAFLKNALHMHSPNVQQNSDDILQQQSAVTVHPLDSQYTTDVLRYVLEGYNALSWLALDSNTHDRLSCLPVHVQVLMQLYHMTATLV